MQELLQPKSFMILPQEPYRSKASVSAKVSQKLDAKIDYEKDFKLLYDWKFYKLWDGWSYC